MVVFTAKILRFEPGILTSRNSAISGDILYMLRVTVYAEHSSGTDRIPTGFSVDCTKSDLGEIDIGF